MPAPAPHGFHRLLSTNAASSPPTISAINVPCSSVSLGSAVPF